MAQRYALLVPFAGSDGEEIFADKASVMTFEYMQDLWHWRIRKLSSHKNSWIWPKKNPAFVYSCPPPFTVSKGSRKMTCHLAQFCPFCWARLNVRVFYNKFEQVIFGRNSFNVKEHAYKDLAGMLPVDCTLLELKCHSYFEACYWDLLKATIPTPIETAIKRSEGAVFSATVEPLGTDHKYTQRMLAIMPKGVTDFPESSAELTVKVSTSNITPTKLAAAVGRVLQYPAGLLTGNFKTVLEILRLRYKDGRAPRMIRTYGSLRNKTKKD